MIIENQLMWSTSCDRHRLDEEPRWPLDNMMHALYTGCAKTIFVKPNPFLVEKGPLKFYDQTQKQLICNRDVLPVLEAAFWPGSDEPWKIDDKGRLIFIWDDLLEFFTNLLWCSKLKMPFVFDLATLQDCLINIRDDLIVTGRIRDPQVLNTLIAIMSLYCQKESSYLQPTESSRGSVLDLWHELHELPTYRELSSESRYLGNARATQIARHLARTKKLASDAAISPRLKGALSIANAAVGLFLGPVAKFGSDAAGKLASMIFAESYVPPIYALDAIERSFDEVWYPQRLTENNE